MKSTIPVIGINGEIGEITIQDRAPEPRMNRPRVRAKGLQLAEGIKYDDHWYSLERLSVRLDPPGEGIYTGREARLLIYVHKEFLGGLSPDDRMQALDRFIWSQAGAWLFSYATRFDGRQQLERWKP